MAAGTIVWYASTWKMINLGMLTAFSIGVGRHWPKPFRTMMANHRVVNLILEAVRRVVLPEAVRRAVLPEAVPRVVLPEAVPRVVLPEAVPRVVLPEAVPRVMRLKTLPWMAMVC